VESIGMKSNRWVMLATLAGVFSLCPFAATAHLNSSGMGPIYDGLLHFFLSPEDIVPVIALAMFTGLRGPTYGRRALFLLPASWFVGCLFGTVVMRASTWPVAAISFLIFGGLVAANAQLSLQVTSALAVLLGLIHGWMNGAGMRWTGAVVVAYVGLVAGIFIVVALVSALVIRLKPPWALIMVRVAGSWVVASGLLLLGWAARRGS
jgi:urease accessory protein